MRHDVLESEVAILPGSAKNESFLTQPQLHAPRPRMQRRKVLIDARGLTLAGFDPIPWEGLQPAERKKLEERDREQLVTRWVIPLTWKGRDHLRDHLSDEERALLVPRFPGSEPTRLFLPGVRGLRPAEFAEVYDAAFTRYWRG